MTDRITITYGQNWKGIWFYLLKVEDTALQVEDAVLRSLSTDGLLTEWGMYCVHMGRRFYPSYAKIRSACNIARNNRAGAALELRGGKWEVVEVNADD